MRLYVGNLARDVTEQDLAEAFAGAGTVSGVNLVFDHERGHSRGFAFVEMATDAEGERALAKLNGQTLKGRPLVLNEARPLKEKPK
jgi:cold-inducible RNA-binding protein